MQTTARALGILGCIAGLVTAAFGFVATDPAWLPWANLAGALVGLYGVVLVGRRPRLAALALGAAAVACGLVALPFLVPAAALSLFGGRRLRITAAPRPGPPPGTAPHSSPRRP